MATPDTMLVKAIVGVLVDNGILRQTDVRTVVKRLISLDRANGLAAAEMLLESIPLSPMSEDADAKAECRPRLCLVTPECCQG